MNNEPEGEGELATVAATFTRSPSPQLAGWFLDLQSARRLDLDPPYQRRSIWNLAYKQFFVDSIIRNYPTASIFLETVITPGQATLYRVIDGKQRLTALFEFTEDIFATSETLEDLGLADKYFSDLPDEIKVASHSYKFTVEGIQGAGPAELNEAFDRLNRNVARLSKQELRHARYKGAFITKIEKLTDHPFWTNIGLVTQARTRRMLDMEYVSEFYVVAMDGIHDGKEYLDDYYALNDDEIEGEQEADRRFARALRFLDAVDSEYPLRSTRFSNLADFYSLWTAVIELVKRAGKLPGPEGAAEALIKFDEEVAAQRTARARKYLLAARQGSNKASNRQVRAEMILDLLS